MTCNAIVATSLQIARRDHPCVSGEPERSGTRTTTTRRPAPGAASTSSGAGPIGARRSTVQPAASEMPVTGDALRNAQPLDADQRCCADVFSVVTCSGRSARRPGSVRRLAVSRHIGRVGGPLGDDDRPFEDFDHRAGLRINPLARPGCALAAVSARKPRAALLGAAAEKSALAFEPAFYVVHVLQLHVVGERVAIAAICGAPSIGS